MISGACEVFCGIDGPRFNDVRVGYCDQDLSCRTVIEKVFAAADRRAGGDPHIHQAFQ